MRTVGMVRQYTHSLTPMSCVTIHQWSQLQAPPIPTIRFESGFESGFQSKTPHSHAPKWVSLIEIVTLGERGGGSLLYHIYIFFFTRSPSTSPYSNPNSPLYSNPNVAGLGLATATIGVPLV